MQGLPHISVRRLPRWRRDGPATTKHDRSRTRRHRDRTHRTLPQDRYRSRAWPPSRWETPMAALPRSPPDGVTDAADDRTSRVMREVVCPPDLAIHRSQAVRARRAGSLGRAPPMQLQIDRRPFARAPRRAGPHDGRHRPAPTRRQAMGCASSLSPSAPRRPRSRTQRLRTGGIGRGRRIARQHVRGAGLGDQGLGVGGQQKPPRHRVVGGRRDGADVAGMGTVAFLQRGARIAGRPAVRDGIPERPEAAAVAGAGEHLPGAARTVAGIGAVPSGGGEVPADVGAERRLATVGRPVTASLPSPFTRGA